MIVMFASFFVRRQNPSVLQRLDSEAKLPTAGTAVLESYLRLFKCKNIVGFRYQDGIPMRWTLSQIATLGFCRKPPCLEATQAPKTLSTTLSKHAKQIRWTLRITPDNENDRNSRIAETTKRTMKESDARAAAICKPRLMTQ